MLYNKQKPVTTLIMSVDLAAVFNELNHATFMF